VVVNSGGGRPAATLQAAGLDVRVIDREERLLPGAVRNLGIDATESPFVAFLAADCRAERGWASARLHAHRAGAPAVATVMTNASPSSWVASAAYLRQHFTRMPDTPSEWRRLYGVSYDRRLFERFGRFREDLRLGEDTEFNARLTSEIAIVCSEEVRTAHRNPERVTALLRDQYARGRRNRYYQRWSTLRMLRRILIKQPIMTLAQARRTSDRIERRRLLAAWPLVLLASVAFAAGALVQRASGRRRVSGRSTSTALQARGAGPPVHPNEDASRRLPEPLP
jgi:hypothetical protein